MTSPRPSPLIVVDYDSDWPHMFERLRARVWESVRDVAVSIEHVGSTSVPGLAAKPVIDIDVVVAEGDVSIGIARLATLGYSHRGDLGVPQREAFRNPPGSVPHNLYLCVRGSTALANHLAIRDYLRDAAAATRAYGDLKKRLALEHGDDVDGYTEAKTEFLIGILRTAGFDGAALDEIMQVNRRPERRSR